QPVERVRARGEQPLGGVAAGQHAFETRISRPEQRARVGIADDRVGPFALARAMSSEQPRRLHALYVITRGRDYRVCDPARDLRWRRIFTHANDTTIVFATKIQ